MPKTLFIDLDGTLVFHNYHPREVEDQFLPGALDFLEKARALNNYCVLTTNRSEENSRAVISALRNLIGFSFDREIYELPVGIRVLINDNKNDEVRAIAIPLERNKGLERVIV